LTWWIGSIGLYFLLRSRKIQPSAAVAAVALYLASGHYMRTQYFQMRALMYFPWIMWASDALDNNPSFRKLALFAIPLGMMLAAGHPAYIVPFVYMIILYRILAVIFDRRGKSADSKRIYFLLFGLILGLMVSAIQNIPTFVLLSESSREISQAPFEETTPQIPAGGNSNEQLSDVKPSKAAVLLTPVFQQRSVLSHPYIGFPMLFLGLFGLFGMKPIRDRCITIYILIIFSILSLPPVFNLVHPFIPGMSISPFYPIAIPQFILAILAGYGLNELMSGETSPSGFINRIFSVITIFAAGIFIALFMPPAIFNPDTRWERESVALAVIVLITGLIAIAAPALTYMTGRKIPWMGGILLPLSITFASICGHFYQYSIYDRLPIMPVTQSITALTAQSPYYRVAVHTSGKPARAVTVDNPAPYAGNLPMLYGSLNAQGYNSFILKRQSNLLRELDPLTLQNNRNSLPLSDPKALSSNLLNAMAVKWLISDDPGLLDSPESGMNPDDWRLIHTGGLNIYEKKATLPRWFLSSKNINMMGLKNLNPTKPSLITPHEINLTTEVFPFRKLTEEYLIFSECWYPEWKAFIDGKEVEIHPANGAYMAVLVPVGEHSVTFKFVPTSFYFGILVALIAIQVLFIGILMESKPSESGFFRKSG
ncbi:MAG TPA: hypothetical protein ENN67_01290, partial [Firmicutes bacterium]|nr:hypothetical protein [Bacillota bacterium]